LSAGIVVAARGGGLFCLAAIVGVKVTLKQATAAQAKAIAKLRTAVHERLTHDFGRGPWSSAVTEKGVLYALRTSRVFIVRDGRTLIGTLQLSTAKPWAIDKSYFSKCQQPLYLTAMAVEPDRQRRGIGRAMLEDVKRIAKVWPSDAIRLDAYDLDGGAGGFYAKCGYREMGRATYRGAPLIYYELLL
jgi:GNAT superfamily N-acetyltransferase